MNCPKCNSDNNIKRGIINDKQRYSCKVCKYCYTVLRKTTSKPDSLKRKALQLYLEGLGFRAIGRFLNVSHVAVYYWIKSFGENLETIKSNQHIKVVEMDEMHTYIAHKKTTVGSSLLLIDMEKSASITLLATVQRVRQKNYGK